MKTHDAEASGAPFVVQLNGFDLLMGSMFFAMSIVSKLKLYSLAGQTDVAVDLREANDSNAESHDDLERFAPNRVYDSTVQEFVGKATSARG
jgi:hypothetical protein